MVEPPLWAELSEGDQFAGYRIERRLGRGGMGILYLALEPGLQRRVALKLIAPEAAAEAVFARRFAEESRIAASIEHPNVVPIYAAGEEGGVPFIAMRYVAGADLARRIASEGRLDPELAVALIGQIGNGLDAIHAAGLVHRDVKPANVLISGEQGGEHAYITDFGVARNLATESGLTQTGRFVGTLDYVAPEQISGGPVDARVDVYALGCLLYKLLTGQVPFPREGEAARLYAHLHDPPPAASLFVTSLPMALDDVVIRALSKQPSDRFPSAGDLGRAAEAALSGAAVAVPERTVATGAAATVEPETVASGATRGSKQPSAETARLKPPARRGLAGGRRLALAGGLVAAVLIAALVVALSPGGGDGGGGAGTSTGSSAAKDDAGAGEGAGGNREPVAEKPKPEPDPLTEPELIAQADRICERSQRRYREIRNPEWEFSADVPYARELVDNARLRVRGLRSLEPPPALAVPYGKYVAGQERVLDTDLEALAAAKRDDAQGVEAARARRDSEDALREELADEIGFRVCSQSQS